MPLIFLFLRIPHFNCLGIICLLFYSTHLWTHGGRIQIKPDWSQFLQITYNQNWHVASQIAGTRPISDFPRSFSSLFFSSFLWVPLCYYFLLHLDLLTTTLRGMLKYPHSTRVLRLFLYIDTSFLQISALSLLPNVTLFTCKILYMCMTKKLIKLSRVINCKHFLETTTGFSRIVYSTYHICLGF